MCCGQILFNDKWRYFLKTITLPSSDIFLFIWLLKSQKHSFPFLLFCLITESWEVHVNFTRILDTSKLKGSKFTSTRSCSILSPISSYLTVEALLLCVSISNLRIDFVYKNTDLKETFSAIWDQKIYINNIVNKINLI